MKISVIIPVFNEINTFNQILDLVKSTPYDKQIIIVDDGSTDGTREIIKQITDKSVITLFNSKNMGKGACIRKAREYVNGEIVIIQDADLEYYPDDYEILFEKILNGKADVVYGSRFIGSHRAIYFWNLLGNKTLNLFASVFLNTYLTDLMTCYKAFKADVFKSLDLKANRFGIEAEITAEIFKRRFRVYEVPISYNGRSYEEGKKVHWTDFFTSIFWLIIASLRSTDVGADTLLKMRLMRNNNSWVFNKISPYLGKQTLEIGSGIGTFSNRIVQHTDHLTASDIDKRHIQYLKKRFIANPKINIKELDATLIRESLPAKGYDTVVSLNMLEHIEDDNKVLRGINHVLEKNGKLLLLVPAHAFLYGSLDKAIHHHRRYNKQDLIEKLDKAGFDIEKIEYMNFCSVFGWFINFKMLKRKTMPLITIRMLDLIIPSIAMIEKIVPFPFGLSLFCVARKR